MGKHILCAGFLWASAAQAEVDFPFDADRLFADHAAKVVHGTDGSETLRLAGGVEVRRDAGGVTAKDLDGPVGGFFLEFWGYSRAVEVCSPFSAAEHALIEDRLSRLTGYVARNAYPPLSVAEVQLWLDAQEAQWIAEGGGLASVCEDFQAEGIQDIKAALLSPDVEARIQAVLATPQLPVLDPGH